MGALALASTVPSAHAISPDSTDADAIVAAVDARESGDRSVGQLTMQITDSAGRSITRTLRTRTLDFEGGTRTLYMIEAPEDVRNTGFLSIDYSDGDKADDQWLYLPSLRRVTRISSSGKKGSFMGSDLTYGDLTSIDSDDYAFKIVEQAVSIDGEFCWRIEARPNTPRVVEETGYVKSEYWVSKSKLIPMQAKHWVQEGRKLKYMKFADVEQIDGIWTAKRTSVLVVVGDAVQSSTVLAIDSIRFGQEEVTEADFTERRMERGL